MTVSIRDCQKYAYLFSIIIINIRKRTLVFIAHVLGHSSKIQFIYTFYEIGSIPFIEFNTINKIQLKYLGFFKENFKSLVVIISRCLVGNPCHCAFMTVLYIVI